MNELFNSIFMRILDENRRLPFEDAIELAKKQYALVVKAGNASLDSDVIDVSTSDAKAALPGGATKKEGLAQGGASVPTKTEPRKVVSLEYERFLADPELLKPGKDTITCGFCGIKMQNITRHIDSAHGVKPVTYLRMFNLPEDMRLDSLASQEKAVARGAKLKGTTRKTPTTADPTTGDEKKAL